MRELKETPPQHSKAHKANFRFAAFEVSDGTLTTKLSRLLMDLRFLEMSPSSTKRFSSLDVGTLEPVFALSPALEGALAGLEAASRSFYK